MQTGAVIDEIYQWIKLKIKPYWVTTFVGGMIIGLLTYGYLMTNRFLTFDSMWNMYSAQDMISSGRQFLTYACGISSYYDLPWLNGLLAVFYLSITSVLVVEGLGIRNTLSGVLTAGLIITFPSVISTFCYSFTVDGYMLACLLSTAAFLLTDRKKWGWCGGMVLLGVALGIYQAFISFTIVLCILRLLLDLLEQTELKRLMGKVLRYAVMGIGGYVFYVVTLKIMLGVSGNELSGYQGTDKVVGFSLSVIPEGLKSAWISFKEFALYGNVLTTTDTMKVAVVVLCLLGVALYAIFFVRANRVKWIYYLIAGVLVALIPFGLTTTGIISPDTYQHTLMRCAWCLLFVFVIALMERIRMDGMPKASRLLKGKKAVVSFITVCAIVLVFEFSMMANIVGYNMHERYEKSYAVCARLVERLEMTEGYEHGMKVAILGGFPNQTIYPSTDVTAEDLVGYFGATGDYAINSTEKYAAFMSHYMNVTLERVSFEEENALVQSKEFEEMPCFPSKDSIQLIGDVWVIKLNG